MKSIAGLFAVLLSMVLLPSLSAFMPIQAADITGKAGADKNGFGEKTLLWISLVDDYFEAGYFGYGEISLPYGGIRFEDESLELDAGYASRTVGEGFLLSHGEYFPGQIATPDARPAGFLAKLKNRYFHFEGGSYFLPEMVPGANHQPPPVMNLVSLSAPLEFSMFSFQPGVALSTTRYVAPGLWLKRPQSPDTIHTLVDPSVYADLGIADTFQSRFEYSPRYGAVAAMHLHGRYLYADAWLMSIRGPTPFSADLYDASRHYYFSFRTPNFKLKIYDTNSTAQAKSTITMDSFGLFHYMHADNTLVGLFYKSDQEKLSGYFSFYMSPRSDAWVNSLGVHFANDWMFVFVQSVNTSRQYYPLDDQVIPARFYYGGASLDSAPGFDHSYRGFQFYWNQKEFFAYVSLLQNYSEKPFEKQSESLALVIRLEYAKTF